LTSKRSANLVEDKNSLDLGTMGHHQATVMAKLGRCQIS